MSKTNKLFVAIENDIRLGVLSFPAIAKKFNVDNYVVTLVWEVMCENELD